VALAATGFVVGVARPLLLATLDPELATLRGIPVRALGLCFLAALAVVSAESTQAVGALLLLGLIAAPGGAARVLTARPYRGLALSGAIAVGSMWGGLALSYVFFNVTASTGLWSRLGAARLSAGAGG